MSIFTRVLSAIGWRGAEKANTINLRAPNPAYAILRSSARAGISIGTGDLDHYMRLAVTNPHVLSAVDTIASRIGSWENFKMQERRGEEWVDLKRHPLLDLLSDPNDLMTGSFLLTDIPWTEPLNGNCYWFVVSEYPGAGKPTELWPLPVNRIRPRPDLLRISAVTGQLTLDYEYMLDQSIILPGENVIHFRTNNPFSLWQGLSKLSALQMNLDSSYAESHWLGTHFGEDNAIPAAVISLPPELDDDQFKIIETDIREQFGGRRRTAITRSGTMDVTVIQHSIADMQVLEHLEYSASEVRRVFKIPEGLNEASSGQSRLAAEQALARDAIQPLCNHIADTLTHKLLPFYNYGNKQFRLVANDLVPADRAQDVSEYAAYSPQRTLNENRKELGLKPLKLTGKLAKLQPLLDEVPLVYAPQLLPLLTGEGAAQADGPGMTPGAAGTAKQLPGAKPAASPEEQALINAMIGKEPKLLQAPLKAVEEEAVLTAALNAIRRVQQ